MEGAKLLTHLPELFWTLPFFAYAEMHYRFRFFFSYLRKAEPEILADAPHRIEPGEHIPVLLLAKDADQFPARLTSVRVEIRQADHVRDVRELLDVPIVLNAPLWWNVFRIQRTHIEGWVELHVFMTIESGGKVRVYRSDNYRTSSHAPLRVFLSPEPLPRMKQLYFGDAHTHSDKTSDQVEFGVPVAASTPLAKAMGLGFFCVADHSYDLDDSLTDYSVNDPDVPKWKMLTEEIARVNRAERHFAVIQGEEVSCRNSKEKNVHFLLFGNKKYFYGSGDGAERWLQTRCENSIRDVLTQKDEPAVAFAAHPLEHVPFLQRMLLSRGPWSSDDFLHQQLKGIQFANGMKGEGFTDGYAAWIHMLLKGHRLSCLAGNDAHGNFNRFRQIGIPFFSIHERNEQLFGKMRTGVYLNGPVSSKSILRSLAEGAFIISDGPVVNLVASSDRKSPTSIGKSFRTAGRELKISARSTNEFGPLSKVIVFQGIVGEDKERLILCESLSGTFNYDKSIPVPSSGRSYMRVEAHTSPANQSDGQSHFCFTNPVWFDDTRSK